MSAANGAERSKRSGVSAANGAERSEAERSEVKTARPPGRKVLNSSDIQITSQRAPSVCFTVTHLGATGGLTM